MFSVIFFEISSTQQKKECICFLAHKHVMSGQKVLFLVDDDNAGKFLDQLLWSFPQESFLPHTYRKVPTSEKVAIATKDDPLWKDATIYFNLQSNPLDKESKCTTAIEICDKMNPQKHERALQNVKYYQTFSPSVTTQVWDSE